MRFPTTLLEFQAQFPDESSCWAYASGLAGHTDSSVLGVEAVAVTSSPHDGSSNAAPAATKAR